MSDVDQFFTCKIVSGFFLELFINLYFMIERICQYYSLLDIVISGLVEFKPGFWVGVKYDEPLGLNDGR